MALRITTLSENTAGDDYLLAEVGLSILVETEGVNILFDTGAGISTSHNADTLGVDLSKIDKIVLSHGHFDHTGGLRQILLRMKKKVEIIAHPDIWAAKYSRPRGQEDKYAGMLFQRQDLEYLGACFNLTTKPVKITDDVMTTGEIPMVTDFEEVEPDRFFVKEDAGWKPDELRDDQSLIVNSGSGLVVILGCAHRGAINTLYRAQQLTGVKPIQMVLGGCHLVRASSKQVQSTIAALRALGVEKLGMCHCTGFPAMVMMSQKFGDRFFFNSAGTSINLP